MNKYVKSYLQALEETLVMKYNISSHKAKTIIQNYLEESLHEYIETVADIIYGDYIEKR